MPSNRATAGSTILSGRRTPSRALAKSDCDTCRSLQRSCDRRQPQCLACAKAAMACKGYSKPLIWRRGFSIHDNPSTRQNRGKKRDHEPQQSLDEIPAKVRRNDRKRAAGEYSFVSNWPPKPRKKHCTSRHIDPRASLSNVPLKPIATQKVPTPPNDCADMHGSIGELLCGTDETPLSPSVSSLQASPYTSHRQSRPCSPLMTGVGCRPQEPDAVGVGFINASTGDGTEIVTPWQFNNYYLPEDERVIEELGKSVDWYGCSELPSTIGSNDENALIAPSSLFRSRSPTPMETFMIRNMFSLGPQIRYENTGHQFSVLLDMYDQEFCTYPVTTDLGINPFRYRRETSTGSQHLLHAVVALACHHGKWSPSKQIDSTEVTRHRSQAKILYQMAIQSRDIQLRSLGILDTLLALWCIDATESALSPWRSHLSAAFDLLEIAGGIKVWSRSARLQAQVSMLIWWDGVISLLSRRPCIFPYSYLEAVLPWEGSHEWKFFELNACPRELFVPMIQLANLTGKYRDDQDIHRFVRPLVSEIQSNLRRYRPTGGDPEDGSLDLDLSDPTAEENLHLIRDQYHCCQAFRFSLLLYILRIFDRPPPSSSTNHHNFHAKMNYLSRLTLDHIISIRPTSPLRKQLLLSLFLAGAETTSPTHRTFIREYCATWFAAYGYQMFTTALDVLEEVWEANDSVDGDYWWGDALDERRRSAEGAGEERDFCFG